MSEGEKETYSKGGNRSSTWDLGINGKRKRLLTYIATIVFKK